MYNPKGKFNFKVDYDSTAATNRPISDQHLATYREQCVLRSTPPFESDSETELSSSPADGYELLGWYVRQTYIQAVTLASLSKLFQVKFNSRNRRYKRCTDLCMGWSLLGHSVPCLPDSFSFSRLQTCLRLSLHLQQSCTIFRSMTR